MQWHFDPEAEITLHFYGVLHLHNTWANSFQTS